MRVKTIFLVALVSVSAWAAPGDCRKDVAKLCKGTAIGSGRVLDCLKSHETEVSTACKANIVAREQKHEHIKAEWKAAHQACKADAQSVCKDVKAGDGRIHKCLKEHEAQLSPGCKSEIAKIKELRQGD